MIKVILGLSLALNVILGAFLIARKPEVIERERLIIEQHKRPVKKESPAVAKTPTKVTGKPATTSKDEKKKDPPELMVFDNQEFQDAGEKMENDRVEFLTENLGLSEEQINKYSQLRDEFHKSAAEFWAKNPMRELSFSERRRLIEIEEEYHQKLEKLYGKENWEKYQKFREEYNDRGYRKQIEDGQPFLFMGL